ncbi:MAG: MBL fold metallo-hydrolase [Verrucomicrobia bacterium]|nr:MBL fold metallo-hydrolase [Verrucomicrobiota bacterium]
MIETGVDELTLIDCGPETVFDSVVTAIRNLGFRPEHVRHLLLTHVHLDHAGGAWKWAHQFGTRIYLHPKGLPHLADPSVLIASATRIYGTRMDALWGKVGATPRGQLVPVDDGAELHLGKETFQVVYTPGHAEHHNAYWLPSENAIFAGDIAGVALDEGPVIPPLPPPDIHLEKWKASLDKIRQLNPGCIYITHFGLLKRSLIALDELQERLDCWAEWIKPRLENLDLENEFETLVKGDLQNAGLGPAAIRAYEQANPLFMSVAGLTRYWRKKIG